MQVDKGICQWYVSPEYLGRSIKQIKDKGSEVISVVPFDYKTQNVRLLGDIQDGLHIELGRLRVNTYLLIYENK